MKTSIETLVRAWVKDNRSYIEDYYETIEDWLTDKVGEDNWMYDFFTDEEVDEKSEDEMIAEVNSFTSNYRCTPAELFHEIQDILAEDEDCIMLDKAGRDENYVAYDCYDADSSEFGGFVNDKILNNVIADGGTIKQFAKFYGFGIFDNKETQTLEVYKID